jgi:hypothetical protein
MGRIGCKPLLGVNQVSRAMQKIQRSPLPALVAAALRRWRTRARDLIQVRSYHPEKHYMRGPGPRSAVKAGAEPKPR